MKGNEMFVSKYFNVGQVVVTHGINNAIAESDRFALEISLCLKRYLVKDWGNDLSEEDKQVNEEGGIDSLDNIQLACKCCNRQKASYLPEKFFDRITEIFMYQMEKKYSDNGNWKLARNLLMEIL